MKGEVECIACKAVVEFIQQELEKNATEVCKKVLYLPA